MKQDILQLEKNILDADYKINNEAVPTSINSFTEFENIGDYNKLLSLLNNGKLQLIIPNHALYNNFDVLTVKRYQTYSDLFSFGPWLVTILLVSIGVYHSHYLSILALPSVYFGLYISGFINNKFLQYLLLGIGVYLLIINNFTIGSILSAIGMSLISGAGVRNVRRKGFLYSALNSEILFCYIYCNHILRVYDSEDNKL